MKSRLRCCFGDLKIDSRGIACQELLIRHLVMPYNLADTNKIIDFIAGEISKKRH